MSTFVSDILKRPGVSRDDAALDRAAVQPFFPGGKLPYEPTPLKVSLDGSNSATYGGVADQLLQRIPGGAEAFVAENKDKWSRLREADPAGTLPVNWALRDKPVQVDARDGGRWSYISNGGSVRKVVAPAPQMPAVLSGETKAPYLRDNMYSRENSGRLPAPRGDRMERYHGIAEADAATGATGDPARSMLHELGHAFLDDQDSGAGGWLKHSGNDLRWQGKGAKPGASYITDNSVEYTQAVLSGLNIMRDVTGRKINTPEEIYALFDEIEADPKVLNQLPQENTRLFRTYLNLKNEDPQAAEALLRNVAGDSYLAQTKPPGNAGKQIKKELA